ncbi:MAG TPA: hypothetical protein VK171_07240, partial [Fimbriimonas sp.]|nr:hypothetical protein [Fimbriimonas sp.]
MGGHASIEAGRISAETGVLKAIIDGSYAPFLTHTLLALLFIVPMTYSLLTKRISHVCSIKITSWLIAFGGCAFASVIFTSFWLTTIQTTLDWALMASTFFAVALYLGQLQAPTKGFYTFEGSAHSPMFE